MRRCSSQHLAKEKKDLVFVDGQAHAEAVVGGYPAIECQLLLNETIPEAWVGFLGALGVTIPLCVRHSCGLIDVEDVVAVQPLEHGADRSFQVRGVELSWLLHSPRRLLEPRSECFRILEDDRVR